jgi:hypothetical protein
MIDLETLQHASFESLVGQAFSLEIGDDKLPMELAEARLLGGRRPDATREPFSLIFRSAPGVHLPQGIYRFENADLGVMEFFITQIAALPAGSEFEAIFT